MKRARKAHRRNRGEGWSVVASCPRCGNAHDRCDCSPEPESTAQGQQATARLRLEKRRGKPVTVIELAGVPPATLRALAGECKKLCGTGGTAKLGAVELQGDHRDPIRGVLRERGMQVKG